MNKRLLLTFLLIMSITVIPINSFAIEDTVKQSYTINLADAYSKAVTANNQLNKNDKSMYDMLKTFGMSTIEHNRNPYNMENEFERLYTKIKSGKFLQSYEQGELVMYYSSFKDSDIFEGKNLSPNIYPEEFPNCDVWVPMMQLKITNESIRTSLLSGVRQLYDSLLSIQDNIDIMTEYVAVSEAEYKDAELMYKNGNISDVQRVEIENNYKAQQLELKKLKRSKENVERSLKKLLGMKLSDNIQIASYKVTESDITVPSYEDCLKKALLNRKEVSLLKMRQLATKIQIKTLDDKIIDYPTVESLKMSKQEALLTIDELDDEIKEQEDLITQDINTKYSEADYQKRTLAIEKLKLASAQKDLDKANLQFKSGNISTKNLTTVKIAYQKSKASYEGASRELASRIMKLKTACGVG